MCDNTRHALWTRGEAVVYTLPCTPLQTRLTQCCAEGLQA